MSSVVEGATNRGLSRLWRRELESYPTLVPRLVSLGIVVLTTCLFYYQYYVISSVSTAVLKDTGMSFTYFVNINVISLLFSAVTSVAAGVTDRYGRANVIVAGVLGCALVCLFALPNVHSQVGVLVWYSVLGALEGIVLVATPALVRDFSPQLGRASAMGFWTIGPVAGSLVATAVVSNTAGKTWQDQYTIAGIAGMVVFVMAAIWLRELSPALRDQIMVSENDRVVLEARARGLDVEAALKRPLRQMMHVNIVGSAVAISLFLFVYYAAVSFFPLYFQTLFGYSESKANSVLTWMWSWQAGSLIVIGYLSDKLRVRKPFMVVGGVGALVMTLVLINRTGHPDTSYNTFALVLSLLAMFLGMAFAPWMASYTETVEDHNPALTATGLSLWGLVVRTVAGLAVLLCPMVVGGVTTLVQDGPQVQALAAKYAPELATAAKLKPTTQAALGADPTSTTAQAQALSEISGVGVGDVAKAMTLGAQYQEQLATATKLDAGTQLALGANPNDQAAQVKALSEISGIAAADVAKTMTLGAQYGPQLATAQAISTATQTKLLINPKDTAAQAQAVKEIMAGLHVSAAEATSALAALGQVPTPDLIFLNANAAKVQSAASALTALSKVPVSDLMFMAANGTTVQKAGDELTALSKVPAKDLTYLQEKGPKVQKAVADSPNQWKHYLWIAVGGELVFLPLIFVMAGYWSPRKARQAAEEHAAMIAAEAAKLA